MRKLVTKVLLASVLAISFLNANVSAVSVTKSFRYDWNTILKSSGNYHGY